MFALVALALAPPPRLVGEPVRRETPTGTLYGTLDVPPGPGPWPAVLLHPGSGPTDRDGNQASMRCDALKMLGRALAARGIAVLRIDKRGVAASAEAVAKEDDLRFETYSDDATGWLHWLRVDGRFRKVGLVGHSEGALIGMLAAKTAKVDAFVSLCGAGRTAGDVLREQLGKNLPEKLRDESFAALAELEAGRTVGAVSADLAPLFRASVQPYLISWLRHDPAKALAAVEAPALLVDGSTDIQIPAADGDRLARARPGARRVTLTGMNHVLKAVPTTDRLPQLAAYLDPAPPLHPQLVDEVAGFLLRAMGGR